jgi:hypothetical protein
MNAIQLLSKRIIEASRSRAPRRLTAQDIRQSSRRQRPGRLVRAG